MTEVTRQGAIENLETILRLLEEASDATEEGSLSAYRLELARSGFQTSAETSGELQTKVIEDSVVHLRTSIELAQSNEVLVPARNALQLCCIGRGGESDV